MTRRLPPSVPHWLRKLPAVTRSSAMPKSRVLVEVEEVGAQLQLVVLADARVLQDAEVDVVDAVGAQDVAAGVADALAAGRRGRVPCNGGSAAGGSPRARSANSSSTDMCEMSRVRHDVRARWRCRRRRESRRARCVGSEPLAARRARRSGRVRNALNCQPPRTWPAKPFCSLEPGQLVDQVAREAVRAVVGRAPAVGAAVVRVLRDARSRPRSC